MKHALFHGHEDCAHLLKQHAHQSWESGEDSVAEEISNDPLLSVSRPLKGRMHGLYWETILQVYMSQNGFFVRIILPHALARSGTSTPPLYSRGKRFDAMTKD